MRAMKDRAIVCNIGHFDSEIQVGALKNFKWHNVQPRIDEVEFPDGTRIQMPRAAALLSCIEQILPTMNNASTAATITSTFAAASK